MTVEPLAMQMVAMNARLLIEYSYFYMQICCHLTHCTFWTLGRKDVQQLHGYVDKERFAANAHTLTLNGTTDAMKQAT